MEGQIDQLTGLKHDSNKPRLDLLPGCALVEIAKVMAFGANKYGDHNWRGGFKWSRVMAALLRHLMAWNEGEDLDPESNISHLAHAGCNLLFLLTFVLMKVGHDDRYRNK